MGTAVSTLDLPVIKGTSGILALTKTEAVLPEEESCIRCGRCVEACPMNLVPSTLDSLVKRREYELFEKNNGMDCIECGCCTLVCPAKRHLTQSCREGKRTVIQNRKRLIKIRRSIYMVETMYTVSSSPHIRSNTTVQTVMKDVLIALLPAAVAGIYFLNFELF